MKYTEQQIIAALTAMPATPLTFFFGASDRAVMAIGATQATARKWRDRLHNSQKKIEPVQVGRLDAANTLWQWRERE